MNQFRAALMPTALLAVCLAPPSHTEARRQTEPNLRQFERDLVAIATEKALPGYAVAIVCNQKISWARGFGYADLEKRIRVRPDTPFRLASLTKPMAAVVLMQLVEEGRLALDDPMKKFFIHPWFEPGGGSWAHYPERYEENPITVRHVLAHTSQGEVPGESYEYSGNIFADLTWVIEHVTGKSYPKVMQERVLERAGMKRSLPRQLAPWKPEVAREIARAYKTDQGRFIPATYPGFGIEPDLDVSPWNLEPAFRLPVASHAARQNRLGEAFTPLYSSQTAAGAVSTVKDLARFDIALDRDQLVSGESRARMFSAVTNSQGQTLPYGLGWFVEDIDGLKVVWHFGWFPPTVSALYVKVPERQVSFIMLANSDGISAGTSWTAEGVRASPFAGLFLKHFVGFRSSASGNHQ